LASLTTDNPNVGFSGGQTQFNYAATSSDITKASVVTSGAQTYNDAVVLKAKTILDSTSGDITFNQNVDGAFALELNAQGNEIFSSTTQVGATTALTSLTTDATGSGVTSGGQTQFNYAATSSDITKASVVTSGAQTYN